MSKTSNKTSEAFPGFDHSKTTEQLRFFAERTARQTEEAYERMKAGAEAFEASLEVAKEAGDELILKSIAAMRAGAEANISQFEALANARTFSEVIEIQGAYMRKQTELALDQAREFQAISQKVIAELARPVREAFDKGATQAAA
ncbi:phasin family protein [Chelativorans sp. SCAU2101]|uniref:Phasin family protein n=1 Tax=Chelativorans petroleitrophicus TaxID=2975484 RepID=A0A9X2X915_9HYPH|nr:phasin family protein [Chelativorans petroleitrophicus]MCT8989910.1 phasin family protein [Chelativorans petroleitrophicus]